MATTLLQTPSDIQPAQSPVVFSVSNTAYTGSEFQYTANVWAWFGAPTGSDSGSYIYSLRKFPNPAGSGIFDLSRILNSTLRQLAAEYTSSVKYYKVEFNYQYASGSDFTLVTGSSAENLIVSGSGGSLFRIVDGYNIYPDAINKNIQSTTPFWPLMTDYATTQSVLVTDRGTVAAWAGTNVSASATTIQYTGSYSTGGTATGVFTISGTGTATTQQVKQIPLAPGSTGFPIATSNLTGYTIQATGANAKLNFSVDCAFKYEPIRILWKNRYGQFDYLNFYKAHYNTFNTDQRVYQPQLGTWQSSTLSYNQFQTKTQRYIVDASEVLDVNSDWLQEVFNENLKQLLVADEIYWSYDQSNNLVKPLTIKTSSVQFKTGVNNKLIQYTISFDIGQPYKLIL
jgi:hypothetical protein